MNDFERIYEHIDGMLYQIRREGEWRIEENVKQSIIWGEKLIEVLKLINSDSILSESAAQELEALTKDTLWSKDCPNSLEQIIKLVAEIKLRDVDEDEICFNFDDYYVSYC